MALPFKIDKKDLQNLDSTEKCITLPGDMILTGPMSEPICLAYSVFPKVIETTNLKLRDGYPITRLNFVFACRLLP